MRPPPNGQPDPRPILDRRGQDFPRLVQATAGVEHPIDLAAVFGPILNLVEVVSLDRTTAKVLTELLSL